MMKNTVLVTGADHGPGYGIAMRLVELGWHVFAGRNKPEFTDLIELAARHPGRVTILPMDVTSDRSVRKAADMVAESGVCLDMLVNNAEVNSSTVFTAISEAQDYDEMMRLYDTNALGALRVVEKFLPFMDKSTLKRLCFVSSEAGSINACDRTSWYGYCMSKTALNMAATILFNRLHREGYTFRVYHPGWGENDKTAGIYAVEYFTRGRSIEPVNPIHGDENRIVLRDWRGRECPW